MSDLLMTAIQLHQAGQVASVLRERGDYLLSLALSRFRSLGMFVS
jgi:hypothetical protein